MAQHKTTAAKMAREIRKTYPHVKGSLDAAATLVARVRSMDSGETQADEAYWREVLRLTIGGR